MIKIFQRLYSKIKRINARLKGVDARQLTGYPINSVPRYGHGNPHQKIYDILNRSRSNYQSTLDGFLELKNALLKIPVSNTDLTDEATPNWINSFLPGLDSVSIYGFLYQKKPRLYLEVGSGNSTKFAKRAITDHDLSTKIISIDPHPRAEIDNICDQVMRQPLEDINVEFFDCLNGGDILLVDNSHQCFMNSDVTAFFLDILPSLKPNILVGIHDICLPSDYPIEYKDRYYNEQYLLACYLLAEGNRFDVVLPNGFVSDDPQLSQILDPFWNDPIMNGVGKRGSFFWLLTK